MADTIIYNGVGFNVDVVKKMTRKEFVTHQMHENHYIKLKPDQKKKVLHAVYNIITGSGPGQSKR